jgi:hypothetical protein
MSVALTVRPRVRQSRARGIETQSHPERLRHSRYRIPRRRAKWLLSAAALPSDGLTHGLLAGAGFVATSFGINYQFANRSSLLWLIDGGYHTVQFVLFGLVLGLFH